MDFEKQSKFSKYFENFLLTALITALLYAIIITIQALEVFNSLNLVEVFK